MTVRILVEAAVLVLILLAVLATLARLVDIILLLLVAVVFAEGIRPLVYRLQRYRMPRVVAILIVFVLLIAITAILIALLVRPIVTEAQSLAANVPAYQRDVGERVNDLQSQLHLRSDLSGQISNTLNTAKDVLLAVSVYIVNFLINFVVVLVLGFLWLTTSDRLKLFFIDLFPTRYEPLVADVLRDMGFRMGGYLRAVAINAVAVGVMSGVACVFLGLPSPVLLGIFVGLTSVIPLVGPFVGSVPAVLLGFTVGSLYPLIVAAVFTVIMLVDGNTIVPLVMNRVLALPAFAVVLSLLIGGALAGLTGALLAVPIAAAIQIIIVRVIVPAVHQSQGRSGGLLEAAQLIEAAKSRPPGIQERRHLPRA
ncbi:MAG: AI-2E family transporter [Candidatus Dormibacteria bacterium]